MARPTLDHPRVVPAAEGNQENEVASEDQDRATRGSQDPEIQAIIDAGEAGVGDLMDVYEAIERHYVAAATSASYPTPVVSYGTNTRRS